MTVHRLSLEADKARDWPASQRVALRLGEELAARLEVEVLSGGAPMDLSGLSARVVAELADGTLAEAPCSVADAAAGLLGVTLHGGFSAAPGRAHRAYVELRRGQELGTTACFALEVLPSADLSAPQAKAHVSALDALEERAGELAGELRDLVGSADVTVSAVRLDPGSEPTASVSGSGLKKHVELGIPSAAAGVSSEQGPAGLLTFHGAAEDAPVVEAVVHGETRQNLWRMTDMYASGVRLTVNGDGSFTISGRADATVTFQTYMYNIKYDTKYTISIDKEIGSSASTFVCLSGMIGTARYDMVHAHEGCGTGMLLGSSGYDSVVCVIRINPGDGASGTYKVMLNEGDTPAPWCPPGLSSAGEMKENLFLNLADETKSGLTLKNLPDGSISIKGMSTAWTYFYNHEGYSIVPGKQYALSGTSGAPVEVYIEIKDSSGGTISTITNTLIFTAPEGAVRFTAGIRVAAGSAVDFTIRPMLNEGDTPAPWCPPGAKGAVVPHAFGPNILRLPNKSLTSTSNGVTYTFDHITGTITQKGTTSETTASAARWGLEEPIIIRCDDMRKLYVHMGNNSTSSRVSFALFTTGNNQIGYISPSRDGIVTNFYAFLDEKYRNMEVLPITAIQPYTLYGTSVDISYRPQIRLSADPADYVPYKDSMCPVPLPDSHPYLGSLPDGTRDELRERWDGTVELVARTHMVEVDGTSLAFGFSSSNYAVLPIPVDHDATAMAGQRVMCDALPAADGSRAQGCLWAGDARGIIAFSYSDALASPDALNALAKSNPIHIIYKRAEEAVYYYDGATWSESRPVIGSMAELRSAGDQTHVWVESGPVPAEVEAHVLLEGGKALGIEHDYVRRAVGALAAAAAL